MLNDEKVSLESFSFEDPVLVSTNDPRSFNNIYLLTLIGCDVLIANC